MRYKHPKSEMSPSGLYGGVGSKNEPENWTPEARKRRWRDAVPAKFRKLRLRRKKRSKMESTPDYVLVPIIVAGIAFLVILVWAVFFLPSPSPF